MGPGTGGRGFFEGGFQLEYKGPAGSGLPNRTAVEAETFIYFTAFAYRPG